MNRRLLPVNRIILAAAFLAVLCGARHALADGPYAYFRVAFADLKLVDSHLPDDSAKPDRDPGYRNAEAMVPRVQLDGASQGEAYVELFNGNWQSYYAPGLPDHRNDSFVLVRAEPGKDISGRLFLPDRDWKRMVPIKFTIPQKAASDTARDPFYRAKLANYQLLMDRNIPGTAWFRHQEREARLALDQKPDDVQGPNQFAPNLGNLDDTYDLFSGGRAVSENLQLDRLMPNRPHAGTEEEETVPLGVIEGLNVKEFNWNDKLKGKTPELDPLSAIIPADQHAVFFPSFSAMVEVIDAADAQGIPVLQFVEPRAEDARTKQKYEKQLCLAMSDLSRRLGPQVIRSVAFTGSDPFLRTGSDVALVFEPKNAEALTGLLQVQVAANRQRSPDAQPVEGKLGDVAYFGARSPDRSICTYVARVGPAMVVTNSLVQLQRLIDTAAGETPALAGAPEYRFFRDRYPRADAAGGKESALVVLTDATIRRWCGPRWRIADSRRTRAAAVMSELQADHIDDLVRPGVTPTVLHTDRPIPKAGEIRLTPAGVTSETYGSLEFLTPIVEMPMEKVTQSEGAAYGRWRDGYQQNWSNYFDPIALRLTIENGKLNRMSADLTVMPLIASSEYQWLAVLAGQATLTPDAGDPHDALVHMVLALDHNSAPMKEASGELGSLLGSHVKADPLAWVGDWAAVYVDNDDAFWADMAKADDPNQFVEQHIDRLPVALCVQERSPIRLAAFMAGVHAFSDQTSPNLLLWEPQKWKDQDYVKVSENPKSKAAGSPIDNVVIYYAATPEFLLVTPSESVMKRSLERQADRQAAKSGAPATQPVSPPAEPWLGASLAARADGRLLSALQAAFGTEYRREVQALAWGDLPILNEYKRLFPSEDPVKLHERLWHTRLVDPAGGQFVWDEQYQTMSSTTFGSPAAPKAGPPLPPQLQGIVHAAFGVTFEDQGLRAKATLERDGPEGQ